METMKQSCLWSSQSTHGSLVLCGFPVVGKPEIWTFKVKFDLEGQGQSLYKTIGILTKVFFTSVPNLAILAWTGEELYHVDKLGDGRTHTQTDTGNDNTQRPKLALDEKTSHTVSKTKVLFYMFCQNIGSDQNLYLNP